MALFGQPENPETDWDGASQGCHPSPFLDFVGPFWPENPEMDWDDKPGLPRLFIPSVLGFLGHFRPENPETDSDDKPGLPRLVIPVGLGFCLALCGQKTTKRTGMTSLGFPGLSSQSISGFFDPFPPENPETDWDHKPGLPRLVLPVGLFSSWPFSARKPRHRLG